MIKHMKKMEFSKKLLIAFAAVEIFVVLFACIMVFLTSDMSPVYYMLTSTGAVVSIGAPFYYWKSKNENRYKYAQKLVNDIANTYGIDMAIRMADVVLKD